LLDFPDVAIRMMTWEPAVAVAMLAAPAVDHGASARQLFLRWLRQLDDAVARDAARASCRRTAAGPPC
jgi:hypothetical protein